MSPLVLSGITLVVTMVILLKGTTSCIPNPMDAINAQAREQYQTTDDVLKALEDSFPIKYKELLRKYGIYRACRDGGTGRWTDNVGKDGSGGCTYCRSGIDDEDKTVKERKIPDLKDQNNQSCAEDKFCHMSAQGCFYYGRQASEAECKTLGWDGNGKDEGYCQSDGSWLYDCHSCTSNNVKWHTHKGRRIIDLCPLMCGYCQSPCGSTFYCKNFGTLNTTSCTCSCYPAFSGAQCEVKNCTLAELHQYCANDVKADCSDWIHPAECPHLCGLC